MNVLPELLSKWIERIVIEHRTGRPIALLFDYDGTLTPIVRHPSLAILPERTRRLLLQLAAIPKISLGVVSGRSLDEVRNFVGLPNVYYCGSGGLELDLMGELERYCVPDGFDKVLIDVRDRLLETLNKFPGTWIELKPNSLAIHYRGMLPLRAVCFRLDAAAVLDGFEQIRFRAVSEAIEVMPADGWDKGVAVLSILAHAEHYVGAAALPYYFGDAPNDLEAMLIVAHEGGLSIGVGPDAPEVAQVRLADCHELADQLEELIVRLNAAIVPVPETLATAFAPTEVRGENTTDASMLILDPDANSRSDLADALRERGWKVFQAKTYEQATELFHDHGDEIQVALVDLLLPGLQGARTLIQFGHSNPDLIRGFVSEKMTPYMVTAFRDLSDSPLFLKPIDPSELDTTLRRMVQCKRSEVSLKT